MQIIINQKDITLSKEQEEFIHKKMEKLQTFSKAVKDESSEIQVNISHNDTKKSEDQIELSVTMILPIEEINATAEAENVEAAVMDVKAKLLSQLEKYKAKHHR
jgi:ribosomal subunit interface protein